MLFVTVLGQAMDPQEALVLSPVFAIGVAVVWYRYVEQGMLANVSLRKVAVRTQK